tara:strand:+ start:769 stop:1227 length:459 start_codon:yes stop_codon:yes gene_type:complete
VIDHNLIFDLIIIGAFIALSFKKESSFAAKVILALNAVYFSFVINMDWDDYYLYTATINTVVGVIIFNKYKLVAILFFLLIPVNILGYLLCDNNYEPNTYNNFCIAITLLQIIVLSSRGLTNGISWGNKRNPLVFLADFDSRKNHAKIQKTT